jgi:hypothetical protein
LDVEKLTKRLLPCGVYGSRIAFTTPDSGDCA